MFARFSMTMVVDGFSKWHWSGWGRQRNPHWLVKGSRLPETTLGTSDWTIIPINLATPGEVSEIAKD